MEEKRYPDVKSNHHLHVCTTLLRVSWVADTQLILNFTSGILTSQKPGLIFEKHQQGYHSENRRASPAWWRLPWQESEGVALWHQTAMDHTPSLVPVSTSNVLSSSKKSPGFANLLFPIYISRNNISALWPSLRFTGRVKQYRTWSALEIR